MTTIVLVHGAWHGPACWGEMLPHLDRAGVVHVEVELPFTGHSDDVAAVATALDEIDGTKLLVGHSYGGLVISGAAEGRSDVDHLVYVCAFMVDKGAAVFDEIAHLPPTKVFDAITATDDGRSAILADKATAAFYNASPPELAAAAIEQLRPMDADSIAHPCLGAPWKTVPSTYVVCKRDEAISPDGQRIMARRAGRVVELDTDHSPFMSLPAETAAILLESVAS